MAQRKTLAGSVEHQVALAAKSGQTEAASWPDEVTLPVDPRDREVALEAFRRLLAARPPEGWLPADFLLLADLAVVTANRDRLQAQIDEEGSVQLGGKNGNTPVKHPAMQALEHYRGAAIQLSRALALTGNKGAPAEPRTLAQEARKLAASGFVYKVAGEEGDEAAPVDYEQLRRRSN